MPGHKILNLSFPPEFVAWLRGQAARDQRPINREIVWFIEQFFGGARPWEGAEPDVRRRAPGSAAEAITAHLTQQVRTAFTRGGKTPR